MKKVILNAALFVLFAGLNAQGYYFLNKQSAGNPGGLNTEMDQLNNGNGGGWNLIMGQMTSPAFSAAQSLPAGFNFAFNGNPVTHFKASSTGYLTFDTATNKTATAAAEALPSANLPDKTISIWGMTATGSNDMVLSKTFGVAPNRQFWIKFQSMSTPGDASNSFSYWSIVLDENTNSIFMVGMNFGQSTNAYVSPKHSLGIQIDGSSALSVTGSPNITNSSLDETFDNNFYYEFIYGTQPATDVQVSGFSLPLLTKAGNTYDVKVKLANRGSQAINTLDLYYSVNGNTAVKTSLSALGLQGSLGNEVTATATTGISAGIAGIKQNVVVWVENVNGSTESNKLNDTVRSYTVVNNGAGGGQKKVMFEEGTGAWCQHCPDAHSYLKNIKKTHGDKVIVIAHHNSDGMAGAGDSINAAFLTGYPGATIDRYYWADKNAVGLSRGDWTTKVTSALSMAAPVDVTVSGVELNTATKKLSWKVKAKFYDYFGTADIRIGGMALEDAVRGTGTAYDQVISGLYTSNASHPYFGYSSPMIGYYHDHVSVGVPSGVWGGKLNAADEVIKPGDSFEITFTHAVNGILSSVLMPSNAQFTPKGTNVFGSGKPVDMRAVGYVSLFSKDVNNRQILNADEEWLWNQAAGAAKVRSEFKLNVKPNPADDLALIEWKQETSATVILEVYDITGKMALRSNLNARVGDNEALLDVKNLSAGIYTVKLSGAGFAGAVKLVVSR